MSNTKYFNFPIQLLEGFMLDYKTNLIDIYNYAIYENSLKYEYTSEFEKLDASANFFNLTIGNKNKTLTYGKKLYKSFPSNAPKVGLNLDIFWDYYKNEKSDFDKVCLLAFLSIKSIVGTKAYCKTTNLYFWSRMDGNSHSINSTMELSDEICHYSTEYQSIKIKRALRDNWGLEYYARYTRGFYVSFKLTLEELITEAEKRRKSTIEKQRKMKEKEILDRVLFRLNETRPFNG